MIGSNGTTVAIAPRVKTYLVRSEIAARRLKDEEERRRRGERIEKALRGAGVNARWIESKTSWLSPEVVDLIEAPDDRAAQAAADLIALTEPGPEGTL